MKFHTEYLPFNTKKHREYIHITPQSRNFGRGDGHEEWGPETGRPFGCACLPQAG